MRFAIINNSVVTNIAEAEAALDQDWIDVAGQDVRIGATFDGSTFSNPAPEAKPDLEAEQATRLKFKTLPVGEFYAKLGAAKSNAITTSVDNKARFFVFCTDRLTEINPNNTSHRDLLKGLIQSGEVTKSQIEDIFS